MKLAVGGSVGDAMSEGAVHASPLGQGGRVFIDRMQDFLVAGEEVILAEKEVSVSPVPNHHAGLQIQL